MYSAGQWCSLRTYLFGTIDEVSGHLYQVHRYRVQIGYDIELSSPLLHSGSALTPHTGLGAEPRV
jgi:hypothetical protein